MCISVSLSFKSIKGGLLSTQTGVDALDNNLLYL